MVIGQNQPVMNPAMNSMKQQNPSMQSQPKSLNQTQSSLSQSSDKWYKKWWVWLVIVIGVILLGGLVWYLFF